LDDPAQGSEPDLDHGRSLYRAGRFDEALWWAEEALGRWPDSYGLWNLKGAALRLLKRPADAVDALERAVSLGPGEVGARMNLGAALLDLRRLDEARAAFAGAAQAAPDYADGWRAMGGRAADAGRCGRR